MARLQTGSIAGLHLELISDHLDQHKRMTDLRPEEEEAIRAVLGAALGRIVSIVGDAREVRPNTPHELD